MTEITSREDEGQTEMGVGLKETLTFSVIVVL